MNKLLLAILLLAISGNCYNDQFRQEIEKQVNAARAKVGQEFNIAGIKGMRWSDKLAKEAKEAGVRCENREVSTGDNWVQAVFTLKTLKLKIGHSDADFFYAIAKKYLKDPNLSEFGFYMADNGDSDPVCKRREQHWVVVAASLNGKAPRSSPSATTLSAMSSPVVFLAIALVFFGF